MHGRSENKKAEVKTPAFFVCVRTRKNIIISIHADVTPLPPDQEKRYLKGAHVLLTFTIIARFTGKGSIFSILELTAVFTHGIIIMKKYIGSANHIRLALFLCYCFSIFFFSLMKARYGTPGKTRGQSISEVAGVTTPAGKLDQNGQSPLCWCKSNLTLQTEQCPSQAEGQRLLSVCEIISRVGSNPTCSAIKKIDKPAELSSFSSAGII